jgi:polyribonucleotide nucleotidyltransferase
MSRSGCTRPGRSRARSSGAKAVRRETAILTARLIDRPLRPTFKEGFRDEVQVDLTVLSVDMANPYDIPR